MQGPTVFNTRAGLTTIFNIATRDNVTRDNAARDKRGLVSFLPLYSTASSSPHAPEVACRGWEGFT